MLPYFAILFVGDAVLVWRERSSFDLLPPIAGAVPMVAMLLTSVAVELGTRGPSGVSCRGLIGFMAFVPLVVAGVIAIPTQNASLGITIAAASPPALGVILVHRDTPEVDGALPLALLVAGTMSLVLFLIAYVSAQGHYRALERMVTKLRSGDG